MSSWAQYVLEMGGATSHPRLEHNKPFAWIVPIVSLMFAFARPLLLLLPSIRGGSAQQTRVGQLLRDLLALRKENKRRSPLGHDSFFSGSEKLRCAPLWGEQVVAGRNIVTAVHVLFCDSCKQKERLLQHPMHRHGF